jgi:hypothetical protein
MDAEIWNDPDVRAALKDGRHPDDIAILTCPNCAREGYYNQGSYFSCRGCGVGFYCCSEEEEPPDGMPWVSLNDVVTLADVMGAEETTP